MERKTETAFGLGFNVASKEGVPRSAKQRRNYIRGLFRAYSPPQVDRSWLRVYYNKIRIYPHSIYLRGTIGFRKVGIEIHSSIFIQDWSGNSGG